MKKVYKSEQRNGYWICVDTRTGESVSYPTTKSNCASETAFMNRTYAELMGAGECLKPVDYSNITYRHI
jgi:hypothetical protein